EKTTGRKLKIGIPQTITLALYKQTQSIATKKSIWNDFKNVLKCSYKTLVVSMNRCAVLASLILKILLKNNQQHSHLIKHTDSTDISVCLNKNAKHHKTMQGLADWGHGGKGWFYGVKLHLTADLNRNILSVAFAPGNIPDKTMFMKLNKDLQGLFVADAGYISEEMAREFYQENKRILFAKPRKNMRKIITVWQKKLYDTRVIIELQFRNLKMFYGLKHLYNKCSSDLALQGLGLITSLPRSISGYFANYIYSILACALK
ncbi:transposase, partial [Patescibacteria group bacterium]|nr:transposase [Patescibacteria group bacterium]